MHEQWRLHCTGQWGGWTPLSEPVYWVAITFKMTKLVEQRIYIKFALSLNIPLRKLFRWFRRPQLRATGDWQLHHNNVPAHASHLTQSVLENIISPRWLRPPYSPDLVPWDFCLFPKCKSPWKGKRFQTIDEIQENRMGQLMGIGRTLWGAKVPALKVSHCPIQETFYMLLVSCIFSSVSIFHITWQHTLWTDHIQYSFNKYAQCGMLNTYIFRKQQVKELPIAGILGCFNMCTSHKRYRSHTTLSFLSATRKILPQSYIFGKCWNNYILSFIFASIQICWNAWAY